MGRLASTPFFLCSALVAGALTALSSAAQAETAQMGRIVDFGPDWTGYYVGAQLGFGEGRGGGPDLDSLIGGYAGYRWDLGKTVLGTELDVTLADSAMNGVAEVDSIARI